MLGLSFPISHRLNPIIENAINAVRFGIEFFGIARDNAQQIHGIPTIELNFKKGCSISYVLNESKIRDIVENILENILSRNDVVVSLTDIRSFDDYTYGHSVNVCVLSLITGNALGLSQKSLTQLGIGAILHDIGKVLTPKEILNKPGNLTEEEFEIIKRHTEEGYNLVRAKKNISNLAASVIYEHHERVNGTGYPRGIRAEEIIYTAK